MFKAGELGCAYIHINIYIYMYMYMYMYTFAYVCGVCVASRGVSHGMSRGNRGMAQGMATQVLEAFDKLSDSDKEVLSVEMARTGTENQSFSEGFVPASVRDRLAGPAFLVYYGPAFLQRMNNDSPVRRLEILAEIYRRARKLWPAASDQAGNFVTLRIDAITIQGKWSSRDPELLLLRMCSNKQAVLERKPGDPKTTNFKEENTEVLFAPDVPNGLVGKGICSQEDMIKQVRGREGCSFPFSANP